MGQFVALNTANGLNAAIAELLRKMLREELVHAVLVPARQGAGRHTVMQTLITNPDRLDDVDPFAPVVTTSGARLVSSLTSRSAGQPVAVVLRSCEVRAFLELVKLRQGSLEDLLLIGIDCLGRYENRDYLRLADGSPGTTLAFLQAALQGGKTVTPQGFDITSACKSCGYPVPDQVDLRLGVLGDDPGERIWLEAVSDKGRETLAALALGPEAPAPAARAAAVRALEQARLAFRRQMLADFGDKTRDLRGLQDVVADCVNCYNCRVACPVCYCRECVFATDTFRHDGERYLAWADKKGSLKVPTDTVFYHLTRMVHMSTLCVGCGQCSSACPNDVPVMELLTSVAERTQRRFDYVPGRRLDEGQPLAIFHAEEFDEVTGQVK